jgi:putative inorganic carbon (HCO3(-)) transporter
MTSHLAPRITGLPGVEEGLHPNQVAGGLVWVLPLMVVLSGIAIIRRREWSATFRQWGGVGVAFVLVIVTLLNVFTFLLTESRSSYIGLVVASIVMLLIVLPSRWRWTLLGSIVVTIVLAVFLLWPSPPAIILRSALWSNTASDAGWSLDTLEGRMELWSRAIYGIQDFPFTGMGLNTFRRVVHILYPLFLIGPDMDIGHAHDEYLQAALDLGIPGLIAFLALYIGAFWMLFAVWKSNHNSGETRSLPVGSGFLTKALVLGLGGGLLAHMIFGLTDATALGAKPGILFWMLLGLICGLFAQQRTRLSDQDANVERTLGISA